MEINVSQLPDGRWQCRLEPVYVFVSKNAQGVADTFERRVYDDVVTLVEGEAPDGLRVILR